MPLVISDEQLQAMKMDERRARIEIACRLFDADQISLPAAAKMAGLKRVEMEGELRDRKIAIYRPTVEELQQDMETLQRLREKQS
jgi:predicted HTH domain antitoxin